MNHQRDLFGVAPSSVTLDDLPCNAAHPPKFDGDTYSQERDQARMTGQLLAVFDLMKDGNWRTLAEIKQVVSGSDASISARLRDFRKPRFGSHTVERRHLHGGWYEYKVTVNRRLPL